MQLLQVLSTVMFPSSLTKRAKCTCLRLLWALSYNFNHNSSRSITQRVQLQHHGLFFGMPALSKSHSICYRKIICLHATSLFSARAPTFAATPCRGEKLTGDAVSFLFKQYMDDGPISPSRKFYFHTDVGKLEKLFKSLKNQGFDASIFPDK